MKKLFLVAVLAFIIPQLQAQTAQQTQVNSSPPMGWITGEESVNETAIREKADALVTSGMAAIGYRYIFITDGWQGGRDKRNNMLADGGKFPSGMKALSDYVHSKGLKLGISSSPAQLTCNGTAGSLHFEDQDAGTFAHWGIDYLKYTYCGEETDSTKILSLYERMARAIIKGGSKLGFGYTKTWESIHKPDLPIVAAGKSAGVWKRIVNIYKTEELSGDQGPFTALVNINGGGSSGQGQSTWNEPPMLAVEYNLKSRAPFTDTEYQSQVSLWSILGCPLIIASDIRNMLPSTKRVLMNEELIALNQDLPLREAVLKIDHDDWNVYMKPLNNGDYAVAILNRSDKMRNYSLAWSALGLTDQFVIRDLWQHQLIGKGRRWRGRVLGHETRVFRLKKV